MTLLNLKIWFTCYKPLNYQDLSVHPRSFVLSRKIYNTLLHPSANIQNSLWIQVIFYTNETADVTISENLVLIIGDLIAQDLQRYPNAWRKYFRNNTLNLGIRNYKIEKVIWKIEHLTE